MRKTDLTKHAALRLKQRKIPEALIQEAKERGHRTILVSRNSVEYKLKNVLGVKGLNLIVIATPDNGAVITSYVEKVTQRHR